MGNGGKTWSGMDEGVVCAGGREVETGDCVWLCHRMSLCAVCALTDRKYRCPHCSILYCSSTCWDTHKHTGYCHNNKPSKEKSQDELEFKIETIGEVGEEEGYR